MKDNNTEKKWMAYAIAACIAVVLYMVLSNVSVLWEMLGVVYSWFKPVVLGAILAYLINPLVLVAEKRIFKSYKAKWVHTMSVVLAVAIMIVVFGVFLVIVIPQIINSVKMFIDNFDLYMVTFQSLMDRLDIWAKSFNLDLSGITQYGDNLFENIMNFISNNTNRIISTSYNIGIGVFNFVISVILAVYFLMYKKRVLTGLNRLLKLIFSESHYSRIKKYGAECHRILIRYFICDLADGCIVGIINFVFMAVVNYPYAVLISVIVGVTNLAPTFGPIVGAVIGAFVLLLVNPMYAVVFVVFTLVLQTLDGYIIKPKLFGETLGIPAVWILVAIIVGGRAFGVIGILLAIPFAAIFLVIYNDLIVPGISSKKEGANHDKRNSIS